MKKAVFVKNFTMAGVQIEVSEQHVKQLQEFYVQRLITLKKEISEREKEIKEISKTLQTLKKSISENDLTEDQSNKASDYRPEWPWVKKVGFAIEFENRPLTTREIVDLLSDFEPSFHADRKRVVASISSVLSSKSGKEFIKNSNPSGDNTFNVNKEYNPQTEIELNVDSSYKLLDDEDDPIPF